MTKAANRSLAERAVEQFHDAEAQLREFLTDPDIHDLMQEFERRVDLRNQALDAAMRAIKGELRSSDKEKLVIQGLGAQKRYKRWYDTDFLANALPAEQADLILTEKITYEVNQTRLEQLARQGEINNEIVRESYRQEEMAPASMPGTPKEYILPAIPVNE